MASVGQGGSAVAQTKLPQSPDKYDRRDQDHTRRLIELAFKQLGEVTQQVAGGDAGTTAFGRYLLLNAGLLAPRITDTMDLGSTSNLWNDIYGATLTVGRGSDTANFPGNIKWVLGMNMGYPQAWIYPDPGWSDFHIQTGRTDSIITVDMIIPYGMGNAEVPVLDIRPSGLYPRRDGVSFLDVIALGSEAEPWTEVVANRFEAAAHDEVWDTANTSLVVDARLQEYWRTEITDETVAVTVQNPTNAPGAGFSQTLDFAFYNSTANPLATAVVWDTEFLLTSTIQPAAGKTDLISFRYDQPRALWIERFATLGL